MKCKIWSRGFTNLQRMEEDVNAWLAKHPDITVCELQTKTLTGVNAEGRSFINITIVLFYKDYARRSDEEAARKLDTAVKDLWELSVRTRNKLVIHGIYHVSDLVEKSEVDLLKLKFSRKSLNEIKENLSDYGLSLGMVLPLTTKGGE